MHGLRIEEVGRGSSTLSGPLKYGSIAAFPLGSFADKERRTPYILRRHCINACYSCSAFVGFTLRFLSSFLYSYLSRSLLSLSSIFSLPLTPLVLWSHVLASYINADVQFISYVTSSTRVYTRRRVRKLEYRPFTCRQAGKPRPALKRLNAPIVAFSSETGTRCTAKRISQVHFAEEALVRNHR